MDTIFQVVNGDLDLIFFFYGLSFFIMGVAILAQPKRESTFRIAGALWFVAWFGITHGANEFLDMWAIIRKNHSQTLNLTRCLCLAVSYLFLFEAGKKSLEATHPKLSHWHQKTALLSSRILFPAIIILIAVLSLISSDFLKTAPVLTRYFLGLPGGLLAGLGFLCYYRHEEEVLKSLKLKKYFLSTGWAFILYGALGGLVVSRGNFFPSDVLNTETFLATVGLPVQLFRTVCAILIVWGILGILKIFEWEMKELRKTMASAIVHDLKNPMTTILNALFIIEREALDKDKKKEIMDIATRSCRNLIGLTDILLDVDRLESGVLKPVRERVKVSQMFDQCTLDMEVASSMGIEVRVSDVAMLPEICADKMLMQRVFCNLLQNAIKSTLDKGLISINTRYKENEKVFLFQIQDNGIGIPKEKLGHLFRKYYRTEMSGRKGTGLGLYFCRLVVEAHGGSIGIESAPGAGTTISITLPQGAIDGPSISDSRTD